MSDFTEHLIEDYDSDYIYSLVVDKLIWNNGELTYRQLKELIAKQSFTEDDFVTFLAACAIVRHIPIYVDGQRQERKAEDCVHGVEVFTYTRIDEDNFLDYSKTSKFVPALKRHDPNDIGCLKAGAGSRLADFEAVHDPTFIADMKASLTKTVSTFHDANYGICPATNGSGLYSLYKLDDAKQIIRQSEVWITDFIPVDRKSILHAIPKKYLNMINAQNIAATLDTIDKDVVFYSRGEFKWPN